VCACVCVDVRLKTTPLQRFKDSRQRLFKDCLDSRQRLFKDCLDSRQRLFKDCLDSRQRLFKDCLDSRQRLFKDFLDSRQRTACLCPVCNTLHHICDKLQHKILPRLSFPSLPRPLLDCERSLTPCLPRKPLNYKCRTCIYIHIYTYICIYMNEHIRTYIYIFMYIHIYVYTSICMHTF